MTPAHTNDDDHFEIDFKGLVRQVLLNVTLLHWFATTADRGPEVLAAIIAARREGKVYEAKILDFLERHVSPTQ